MDKTSIKIRHGKFGFFSCCSIRLYRIVDFINKNKRLPNNVDSSNLFKIYKKLDNEDITFDFFKHYENLEYVNILQPINYHHYHQFKNYADLDYKCIEPLIKKYFSPSNKLSTFINTIEKKYNIVGSNTLAVYYRGTDKYKETQIASFNDFYNKIIEIVNINKDIKILIQTDSAEFIDYTHRTSLKNVIIIDENKTSYSNKGIHNEQSYKTNYEDMFYFLSTIIIISKCKYIICSSGNCSIWTMLYRGNNKNTYQYLNGSWYNNNILSIR